MMSFDPHDELKIEQLQESIHKLIIVRDQLMREVDRLTTVNKELEAQLLRERSRHASH